MSEVVHPNQEHGPEAGPEACYDSIVDILGIMQQARNGVPFCDRSIEITVSPWGTSQVTFGNGSKTLGIRTSLEQNHDIGVKLTHEQTKIIEEKRLSWQTVDRHVVDIYPAYAKETSVRETYMLYIGGRSLITSEALEPRSFDVWQRLVASIQNDSGVPPTRGRRTVR